MQKTLSFLAIHMLLGWMNCIEPLTAQTVSAPVIDTPLTSSHTYFYNGEIIVPYASGHVSVTNNASVKILSTTDVDLLPGFTASVDSGCGEFVAGIRECDSIMVNAIIKNPSCFGSSDGQISLEVSGGQSPYQFNWKNKSSNSNILFDLSSGNYSVDINDNQGCATSKSVTLTSPSPLQVNVSTVASHCHQSDGAATLSPSGGNGDYSYFWERNGENLQTITNLSAGTYKVHIADHLGCAQETIVNISDTNGPQVDVQITSTIKCHGGNDASVSITLPYTGPEPVFPCGGLPDRLSAGNYSILQEDTNGCITLINLTISEPEILTCDISTILPTCGNHTGSAIAHVSGGVLPYSFSWNNGGLDSINDNLFSGIDTVVVLDGNGCRVEKNVFIPDSNTFSINVSKQDVSCNKSSDGKIAISLTGGQQPFSYHWFDELHEINKLNADSIDLLPAGSYTVFIEDGNYCKSTREVTISYPDELTLRAYIQDATTDSTPDGSIELHLNGGSPPYIYQWSNGRFSFNNNQIKCGVYYYRVSDQKNCSLVGNIELSSFTTEQMSACSINSAPFYANIEANCTTCNPSATSGELNIVTDFGAIPNDGISDEESFEWACDFINTNYCSIPVTLVIPPGSYIVGRQDHGYNNYAMGHDVLCFQSCSNITIEGQNDAAGNHPKIQFEDCLKYGAFDPVTDMRHLHNTQHPIGAVTDYYLAAWPGNIVSLQYCDNIKIYNLDLDGNIDNFNIGGYFALDLAGINRPNCGFYFNESSHILIENCSANHFGYDGMQIKADGTGPFSEMDIRVLFSKFNYNSRCGLHWDGGSGVYMMYDEFNHNGFGPWGGTKERDGVELEIDELTYRDMSNGHFINCNMMFNHSCGIHCNANFQQWNYKAYNFEFSNCQIVNGERGYASWFNVQDTKFRCCNFVGTVLGAYDASNTNPTLHLNTRFISCEFNEEFKNPETNVIEAFTKNSGDCFSGILGQADNLINIDNGIGRVLFDDCTFKAGRYCSWALLNGAGGSNNKIIVKNSTFIKERGDNRSIGAPGDNSELINLSNTDVSQNNWIITPHNNTNYSACSCAFNDSYPWNCWWGNCCSINGVIGHLHLPPATAGNYCDAGTTSSTYCENFFQPDGYSDASYTPWYSVPCLYPKYRDPISNILNMSCSYPCNLVFYDFDLDVVVQHCSTGLPNLNKFATSKKDSSVNNIAFPVPSNQHITITNCIIGDRIFIYNTLGEVVLSNLVTSKDQLVDIQSLHTGIYFIKINSQYLTKFIKSDD